MSYTLLNKNIKMIKNNTKIIYSTVPQSNAGPTL